MAAVSCTHMLGFLLKALVMSLTTLWTKTSTSSSDSAIFLLDVTWSEDCYGSLERPGETSTRLLFFNNNAIVIKEEIKLEKEIKEKI